MKIRIPRKRARDAGGPAGELLKHDPKAARGWASLFRKPRRRGKQNRTTD